MKTFEAEIEINAPIEVVWQYLTDFSSYPEWNPFVIWAEGAVTEGSLVRFKVANQPIQFQSTIISLIPNQEFIWEAHPIPGLSPRYIRKVEKISDNRTRFFHRDEFSGWIVPLISPILTKQFGGFYVPTCEALKQKAEATLLKTIA